MTFPGLRLRPVTALLSLVLLPGAASAGEICHRLDTADFAVLDGCTQSTPGTLRISPAALARLDYDDNGLAAVMAGKQHYYVRRDGRHLAVISYDNGPDHVAEGLVRARVDDRIGYYDLQLQPAFSARFDWGFPFHNGVAEVCNGCRKSEPDANGHTALIGGKRFHIDRQGQRLPDPR